MVLQFDCDLSGFAVTWLGWFEALAWLSMILVGLV